MTNDQLKEKIKGAIERAQQRRTEAYDNGKTSDRNYESGKIEAYEAVLGLLERESLTAGKETTP